MPNATILRDPFLSHREQFIKDRLAVYPTSTLLAWRDHPHFPPTPLRDAVGGAWQQLTDHRPAATVLLSLINLELADRNYPVDGLDAESYRYEGEEACDG